MPKQLLTYRCLVISPSDVPNHRDAVERAIHTWNAHIGPTFNARIEPVRWESNARPQLGNGPQAVLNEQLVDDVDFGIAFFWGRLGTPTDEHESGSVEEIERLLKRGAEVMVYFCTAPVPQETLKQDTDGMQFVRLQELKQRYDKRGILCSYGTADKLRELVGLHVNGTLNALLLKEHGGGPDKQTRDAMRARELRLERLRAVRAERIAKVVARETPKPVGAGPKMILHAMPMRDGGDLFGRIMSLGGTDRLPNLRPMWDGNGFSEGRNFDGYVTWGGPMGDFAPYVQLFRNGVIEAVGRVWESSEGGHPRFSGMHVETDAIYALEKWQRLWQLVGEPAPMFVALTMTNVRGYHVPTEHDHFGRNFHTAIDRDVLELPEIILEDLNQPTDVILKPAFDLLWQAGGWNGSPNYRDGRHRQGR